ncbi:MAG: flagellar filament capping protein FliD [Sulfuricurvum sp.]
MAVSSLGAGSGVLTQDVIDQLKSADETATITPLTNRITLQQQKSSAYSLLTSLMTSFKSSVSALDDDSLYQQRSVSGSTSSVSVTADSGVSLQSFSISDTVLAKKDVQESGSYSSSTSTVATGSGTMSLSISGLSFDVNYTSSTTLEDLKNSINDTAGARVSASILQVGSGDYRLVLTSKDTGADQAISISDSTGGSLGSQLLSYDATTNPDGMQNIQAASDASFKYNGITLTRSSNTVDDIITGVTINLLEDGGSANVSITQDVSAVSDELSNFVTNYNSLMSQLTSMTTSDKDAGTVGIFNGDNDIKMISREINKILISMNSDGLSLPQFGIDLAEDGTMSFNSSTFTSKFNEDAALSEKFFSGLTTVDNNGNSTTTDGIFTTLNNMLNNYTKSNGILSTLSTASTDAVTKLTAEKTRAQALLDARYETMATRFSMYDTLMTQLTNQFSSLQQQISMAVNGTSSS